MSKKKIFRLAMALLIVFGLTITANVMAAEKGTQETIQGMLEQGNKGMAVIKTGRSPVLIVFGLDFW